MKWNRQQKHRLNQSIKVWDRTIEKFDTDPQLGEKFDEHYFATKKAICKEVFPSVGEKFKHGCPLCASFKTAEDSNSCPECPIGMKIEYDEYHIACESDECPYYDFSSEHTKENAIKFRDWLKELLKEGSQ